MSSWRLENQLEIHLIDNLIIIVIICPELEFYKTIQYDALEKLIEFFFNNNLFYMIAKVAAQSHLTYAYLN